MFKVLQLSCPWLQNGYIKVARLKILSVSYYFYGKHIESNNYASLLISWKSVSK